MKVTSNLSFLLCMIGTIAMPVVEASLNGLELKRSSAATMRAAKNQKAFEVAMRDQRRGLKSADALCEAFLPNSGCTCSGDLPSQDCSDFITENCSRCDTLQNQEACLLIFDEEAVVAAFVAALVASPATASVYVDCTTYKSGPFADDSICVIENLDDNNCTFTINETECNSCTVVDCGEETDFDIDCSNVIAGETWNLCTDDIPETSLFIALGTNDRFQDLTCTPNSVVKESGSGGVAAASHVLSLFGLIIVACFL
jgi:hypothetical protein